jgi:hypothetical protein
VKSSKAGSMMSCIAEDETDSTPSATKPVGLRRCSIETRSLKTSIAWFTLHWDARICIKSAIIQLYDE